MSRDQIRSSALLLFVGLLIVLPAYGLYTGDFGVTWSALILGGALFVWKWRWWWLPIRKRVTPCPDDD